ncbi:MAG: zinc-ribbon domain-containing protein, partial [Anaerolineae bacterium]
MPVCPNCGNQAAENAIFCDQCGTRLPAVEAE